MAWDLGQHRQGGLSAPGAKAGHTGHIEGAGGISLHWERMTKVGGQVKPL